MGIVPSLLVLQRDRLTHSATFGRKNAHEKWMGVQLAKQVLRGPVERDNHGHLQFLTVFLFCASPATRRIHPPQTTVSLDYFMGFKWI